MLTVREIMTSEVTSVFVDDTVYRVADMMSERAISGAPVRDRTGKFVGVVSQSDLVNPCLHGGVREPSVADVMTSGVVSVVVDEPARAAAYAMASHDIHRIFVVDRTGCLVGVVSSLDIVRAVARGERFDRAGAAGLEPDRADSAA